MTAIKYFISFDFPASHFFYDERRLQLAESNKNEMLFFIFLWYVSGRTEKWDWMGVESCWLYIPHNGYSTFIAKR